MVKKKQGKFLLVENKTGQWLNFRNPNQQMQGMADLVIAPYVTIVAEKSWLDVSHFVGEVENGSITYTFSDSPPKRNDLRVPPELALDDPLLEQQALQIVTKPVYDHISQAIVGLNPLKRGSDNPDSAFLKTQFKVFLENIKYREKQWRNRTELISAVDKRLKEIKEL